MTDKKLVLLALRRYPYKAIDLAVMFFQSDRRRAGLGALDERRRRGKELFRRKRLDLFSGDVFYEFGVNRPARREYVQPDLGLVPWSIGAQAAALTIAAQEIPAETTRLAMRVPSKDLLDQSGRSVVAAELRRARRPGFRS